MNEKKSSVDLDPPFENKIYPCWSVKIFKDDGLVQVLKDKEIKKTFRLSSFPEELDLNKVETISSLLATVKSEGVEGLRKKYNLKGVRK